MRAVSLAVFGLFLSACYTCDLVSHDACIAYVGLPVEEGAQERWDTALERSAEAWGMRLSKLEGWTIVVHDDHPSVCVLGAACTLPWPLKEIHVDARPCPTWYVAHEIGHVKNQADAVHSSGGWDRIGRRQWWYSACGEEREH